jgi:hypothetical protein
MLANVSQRRAAYIFRVRRLGQGKWHEERERDVRGGSFDRISEYGEEWKDLKPGKVLSQNIPLVTPVGALRAPSSSISTTSSMPGLLF